MGDTKLTAAKRQSVAQAYSLHWRALARRAKRLGARDPLEIVQDAFSHTIGYWPDFDPASEDCLRFLYMAVRHAIWRTHRPRNNMIANAEEWSNTHEGRCEPPQEWGAMLADLRRKLVSERDEQVITMAGMGMTLQEIGEQLGVTRQAAHVALKNALARNARILAA